jgi:hypothetical protein
MSPTLSRFVVMQGFVLMQEGTFYYSALRRRLPDQRFTPNGPASAGGGVILNKAAFQAHHVILRGAAFQAERRISR